MLRIEKLFLQGFKSFCDPTEVVFDAEGVTAVVGPNGCGKSNVADALSWVIGEQRAKALRGGKMEDVIFQGSRNRQPSGLAEVSLTLVVQETFELTPTDPPAESQPPEQSAQPAEGQANKSHAVSDGQMVPALSTEAAAGETAPLEEQPRTRRKAGARSPARIFHAGERITIARRLYRTGESEYEMNGRSCRLRDIQDLFAGTGLGGAHYAIIEQGRIGQILSAKPLDRRGLIEEAAGVSKFKLRQHAAELKLEATRQNLSRVTDIIAEVDRQQSSLKRQAARAQRYKRLRQEIRELLRAVFAADFRATRDALAALEESRAALAGRETRLSEEIAKAERQHAEAEQEAYATESKLNDARAAAAETNLQLERTRQRLAYLADQLQKHEARMAAASRDRVAVDERTHFIRQEVARLRAELAVVEGEINAESSALSAAEGEHRERVAAESSAESELAEAQRRVTESATQRERWRQLRRQFADAVERCRRQLEGLAAEHVRAAAAAEHAAAEQAEISVRLTEAEDERAAVASDLAAADRRIAEQRAAAADLDQSLRQCHRERTAVEQRLKSLVELDERHAHFSEAVQVVVKQARERRGAGDAASRPFRVLGALADFIHVAPEHEAMIETGLREELQYLLVPSYDDALGAMEFLASRGQGRATFLVTGLHGASDAGMVSTGRAESPEKIEAAPAPSDGRRERLFPLLGVRPDFAPVLAQALPSLLQIDVVDDVTAAIEAAIQANGSGPATAFITRRGERVCGGRILTGGAAAAESKGILALKREIQELRGRLQELTAAEENLERALGRAQETLATLGAERAALDESLREVDQQLALRRQQLQQCERDRARTATHLAVIERERAHATEERGEAEAKLQHAEAETQAAEATHAEAEASRQNLQETLAAIRRTTAEGLQELSRRRADFAAKLERRKALQNEIRRLENEIQELARRLDRHEFDAVEAAAEARLLAETRTQLTAEAERLATQSAAEVGELEAISRKLAARREELHGFDLRLRELRETLAQARDERAQRDVERAHLTSNLEHIAASCQSELGEEIAEICARLDEASDNQAQPVTTLSLSTEADEADTEESVIAESQGEWRLLDVPADFDLAAAKARIDQLRTKVDNLGPVNLMAIDELREVEQRLAFLVSQKADIELAVTDLQSAIAEIKRRSRERFAEAFQIINRNFGEMFTELFGGGHGEMRLIDETDILESGIDIIAQPPGKRLQNVLLLSGGEKAMAALALVMAIFKYRPSPFCLLDEVDAPLDEANITRFAAKVLEMSARTQFMVITHSKRTMEAARTLYGVTMEDPGVSKLISVKLT